MMPGLDPSVRAASTVHAVPLFASSGPGGGEGFATALHGVFEIVNPLQHLPVVGTLYRALSGDKIGTFEKIAGDTLYGGMWGAVSSVADAAFEAVTGKDAGATVLALFTGEGKSQDKPVQVATATQTDMQSGGGVDVAALSSALSAKGVDSALSARALYAYRQNQGLGAAIGN